VELFAGMHTHCVNGPLEFGSAFGGTKCRKMPPKKIILLGAVFASAVAKIPARAALQFTLAHHGLDATAYRLSSSVKMFANRFIGQPGFVEAHQCSMDLRVIPVYENGPLIVGSGVGVALRAALESSPVVKRCDA